MLDLCGELPCTKIFTNLPIFVSTSQVQMANIQAKFVLSMVQSTIKKANNHICLAHSPIWIGLGFGLQLRLIHPYNTMFWNLPYRQNSKRDPDSPISPVLRFTMLYRHLLNSCQVATTEPSKSPKKIHNQNAILNQNKSLFN